MSEIIKILKIKKAEVGIKRLIILIIKKIKFKITFKITLLFRSLIILKKEDKIPLKWKILFIKSLFWTKSHFCSRFYKLLQVYNHIDYYDFDDLKITFFSWKTWGGWTCAEFYIETFLIIIFPFLYGGDVYHPLNEFESNYFDDRDISIEPTDIVFDCGAFNGQFTVGAAKKANKGKVFAFEPFKENAKILLKNVRQNNLKNVVLIQKAVCESERELIINYDANSPSSSGIYSKPKLEDSRLVNAVSIDKICRDYNLKSIDFIKMDIEGMERDALRGAQKVISKFKPKLSICTYHLSDDREILPKIIRNIRSDYTIKMKTGKLYAY